MISLLYVDDEPELLQIAKIFLEETAHFKVDTAGFSGHFYCEIEGVPL